MINMIKYLLFVLFILIVSCTEQGDTKKYSLSNTTNYNIEVILYDRFGKNDTALINNNDFKIMYDTMMGRLVFLIR